MAAPTLAEQQTKFEVSCRMGGNWSVHSEFPEDQWERALETAESLDRDPGYEGVRVSFLQRRAAKGAFASSLAWLSPRLRGVKTQKPAPGRPAAEKPGTAAPVRAGAQAPPVRAGTQTPPAGAGAASAAAPSRLAPAGVPSGKESAAPKKETKRAPAAETPARALSAQPPAAAGARSRATTFRPSAVTMGTAPAAPSSLVIRSKRLKMAPPKGATLFTTIPLIFVFSALFAYFAGFATTWLLRYLEAQQVPLPSGAERSFPFLIQILVFSTSVVLLLMHYVSFRDLGFTVVVDERVVPVVPLRAPPEASGPGPDPGPGEPSFIPTELPPSDDESQPVAGDQSAAATEPPGGAEASPPPSVPVVTHENRKTIMRFLEGLLTVVSKEIKKLTAYVSFGLNLILAGAIERLAETLGFTQKQRLVLIQEGLEALGTSDEIIGVFTRKYAEYRIDAKFQSMFEAGRDAMDRFLGNDPNAFLEVATAIRVWTSSGQSEASDRGVVVVMFTDMVGSTALTQEKGDFAAQEVVRAHNAIVRAALAANAGQEVKHTGDGIMAAFRHASSAVKATIEIQREIAKHNGRKGAMPVQIRIGLNAGETVQEEDDYYGTAVQLAARVCAKAGTGEIWVSGSVKDLCQGYKFPIDPAGEHELKGIKDKVPLFVVRWQEAAP